jgi:hypothetical protein
MAARSKSSALSCARKVGGDSINSLITAAQVATQDQRHLAQLPFDLRSGIAAIPYSGRALRHLMCCLSPVKRVSRSSRSNVCEHHRRDEGPAGQAVIGEASGLSGSYLCVVSPGASGSSFRLFVSCFFSISRRSFSSSLSSLSQNIFLQF